VCTEVTGVGDEAAVMSLTPPGARRLAHHRPVIFLFKPPLNRQMAATTPRASGLWEYPDMNYSRLSAHETNDDAEENEVDSRTPLDKTIDQIGMGTCFLSPYTAPTSAQPHRFPPSGTYQWALLFLCGFGV